MASTVKVTITKAASLNAPAKAAVERVGAEIMRDARLLAPRSPRQPAVKNPAARVTGNLKNSITMTSSMSGTKWLALVGTSVHYGVYQEFGTKNIPPRPFLGPALEKARKKWS